MRTMPFSRALFSSFFVAVVLVGGGLAPGASPSAVAAASRLAPQGVVDRGVLYVADTMNHRIQRSVDGGNTWTSLGGGKGRQPGQFIKPSGVAANADGTVIFVADTGNNRIQRSRDSGATWEVIAGAGTRIGRVRGPLGLAYDNTDLGLGPADILFVADTLNNRVQCAVNASEDTPGWAPYAAPGRAVGRVLRPAGLAVSTEGEVWIADCGNNRIQHFDHDHKVGQIVPRVFAGATAGKLVGKMSRPTALHVDEQGRVYVADTGNSRVQVNTTGAIGGWTVLLPKGTGPGTVKAPEGVAVSDTGAVFVADSGNHRILRIPAGGTAAQAEILGAKGSGPGQYNRPTKIR